jgi:hypothetical protein
MRRNRSVSFTPLRNAESKQDVSETLVLEAPIAQMGHRVHGTLWKNSPTRRRVPFKTAPQPPKRKRLDKKVFRTM